MGTCTKHWDMEIYEALRNEYSKKYSQGIDALHCRQPERDTCETYANTL